MTFDCTELRHQIEDKATSKKKKEEVCFRTAHLYIPLLDIQLFLTIKVDLWSECFVQLQELKKKATLLNLNLLL